ncbi:hypothetical protein [Rugamonas sp.]|uniref:hypothetical protein n=1 Tax=Rugamonas sp. TaxID=1926287 RepID=UPI0025E0191E|nr:hypothetical protein [Rugamonas sp.]
MIVLELTAAIDAAGTLRTFYVSEGAFTTGPADTPAHISFVPALLDPGSLGVSAYANLSTTTPLAGGGSSGGGTTGGEGQLQVGEISLANTDGQFDSWLNYGFDGRPVVIRNGQPGAAYPAGFKLLFSGTIENIDANWKTLILKLRDKQFMFTQPVLTNTYLGNNALPRGVEGVPADLMGQVKPKIFGSVFSISPKLVNTSFFTYQVSDGPVSAINAVYDRGSLLTFGADYATVDSLQFSGPTAGTYNTCLALGYFQTGSQPAGTVTADVVQGATIAKRTVAQILALLGVAAGLTSVEISSTDVAAMDAINSATVGVFIDGTTTFQSVMDQVSASIGAWYGFDPAGVLRMGVLTNPSGVPKLSLFDYDFSENIERRAARDSNIPAWKVTTNYAKIWTVQTDLAGSVPAATVSRLALPNATAIQLDATIKQQFKLATEIVVDGLLVDQAAATTEASRQLALQKVRRDIFDVPISVDQMPATPLVFLDVIQLTVNRFGLNGGKLFRLIGITYQLATRQIILTVWG